MKITQFKRLSNDELQNLVGGYASTHLLAVSNFVNLDWLKLAAEKLRANLHVAPPIGPPVPK